MKVYLALLHHITVKWETVWTMTRLKHLGSAIKFEVLLASNANTYAGGAILYTSHFNCVSNHVRPWCDAPYPGFFPQSEKAATQFVDHQTNNISRPREAYALISVSPTTFQAHTFALFAIHPDFLESEPVSAERPVGTTGTIP